MTLRLLLCVVVALTAEASDAPKADGTTPPPEKGGTAKSSRYFEITDYLKGTAEEIGEKVNAETRRLLDRKDALTQEIEDIEKGSTLGKDQALDRLRKGKPYLKAKQDVARAEQEMNRVRRSGTSKQKLEASGRFNRAREVVKKMEAAAAGNKQDGAARLAAAKEELARCESSLVKAAKWRAHLIQATRNGMLIFAPVKVGAEGILGKVRIVGVRDAQNVVVEYMAPREEGSLGTSEGVPAVEVSYESTTVRIKGVDTSAMKQGESIMLDRNFVMVEETPVPGRAPIYVAEPKPNGVEELFARMTELDGRVPEFPPEELQSAEDPNAAAGPTIGEPAPEPR